MTGILGVALFAALAALMWGRVSLNERISQMDGRLSNHMDGTEKRFASINAGLAPIHTRCEELAVEVRASEQDIDRVETLVVALDDELTEFEIALADGKRHLGVVREGLRKNLENARLESVELRYALEENSREAENLLAGQKGLLNLVEELGEHSSSVPVGTILPWVPNGEGFPAGWRVCDGTNGTPDLRGLFLRGVGSLAEAAYYHEAETMQAAGAHSHASKPRYNIYNQVQSIEKAVGDWLVLYDTGFGGSKAEDSTRHGAHVHADTNVPAHFTVVYITKVLN